MDACGCCRVSDYFIGRLLAGGVRWGFEKGAWSLFEFFLQQGGGTLRVGFNLNLLDQRFAVDSEPGEIGAGLDGSGAPSALAATTASAGAAQIPACAMQAGLLLDLELADHFAFDVDDF